MGGLPLNPYLFWWLYRRIVFLYTPNQPTPPPDDAFVTEDQVWFLEYTQKLRWFEEWLDYYEIAYRKMTPLFYVRIEARDRSFRKFTFFRKAFSLLRE